MIAQSRRIERQISSLLSKIKAKNLSKDRLESEFLSIKDRIKNIENSFIFFILKYKINYIHKQFEIIIKIKNKIDMKMKNGESFDSALNSISLEII